MDRTDGAGAFCDGRSDALHRAITDVADGEHARHTCYRVVFHGPETAQPAQNRPSHRPEGAGHEPNVLTLPRSGRAADQVIPGTRSPVVGVRAVAGAVAVVVGTAVSRRPAAESTSWDRPLP